MEPLKPGDVVRIDRNREINKDFLRDWGLGPFVITRQRGGGEDATFEFETPEGVPIMRTIEENWLLHNRSLKSGFIVFDEFLTRVRKQRQDETEKAEAR